MKNRVWDNYLPACVLLTPLFVTLTISTKGSIDPINLPKLCVLIVCSFISFGLVLSQAPRVFSKSNQAILMIAALFIVQLLIVFLLDKRTFALKFYGVSLRNTGFVAYLSLTFLLITSTVSSRMSVIKLFVFVLMGSGCLLAIYGIFQSKGFDFYKFDNAYSSNVFGTFGNPNFQSAFMGIAACVTVWYAILGSRKVYIQLILLLAVGLEIYNMKLSSDQGFYTFFAGLGAGLLILIYMKKKNILGWTLTSAFMLGACLVFLGLLDKGPLNSFLYKSSVQARGFYWSAGIEMMANHPFVGVGMDGFGDWYRRSRTIEVARFNPGIVADSAHSIPLDIGAGGGVPLLLIYFAIQCFVLLSVFRVIKRSSKVDVQFLCIVTAWVAYQAQSLISINQLGIGVWGWIVSGLIIGYEINTRITDSESKPKKVHNKNSEKRIKSLNAITLTVVFSAFGFAIALPPYAAAGNFLHALETRDPKVIQSSATIKPFDRSRFLYVAAILKENNLNDEAISVLRKASSAYPDSFEVWSAWAAIQSADYREILRAKKQMRRLDPYNPDL